MKIHLGNQYNFLGDDTNACSFILLLIKVVWSNFYPLKVWGRRSNPQVEEMLNLMGPKKVELYDLGDSFIILFGWI